MPCSQSACACAVVGHSVVDLSFALTGATRERSGGGVVGRAAGNASALAHIMYLKSYEHMGTARVSCATGCACSPLVLDAHETTRRDSLETVAPPLHVHGQPHATCVLRVRLLPETSSGEHKFKLTALIVTPPQPDAVAAVADVQDFVDSSPTSLVEQVVTNTHSIQL
jgi:hypothetical protein